MNAIPLLLACVQSATAADDTSPAAADQDVLVLYCAGLDKVLADPKDRPLLQLLSYVDDRLAELPTEWDEMDALPPDALPLLERFLEGSMSFRIGVSSEMIPGMPIPLFAELVMPEQTPKDAHAISARIAGLMALAGMPIDVPEGALTQLAAPVPVWIGERDSDFVIAVGKQAEHALALDRSDLPSGVEPALGVQLDYGRMLGFGLGIAQLFGEDTSEYVEMANTFGLNDMRIEWVMGSDDERTYSITRMPGYAATMRELGTLAEGPVSGRAFELVPEDASWAMLAATNVRGTLDMVLGVMQKELNEAGAGADPIEMIANATGVHLQEDVIDHLGSTWGIYASDTTGGGGWLSGVAFFELTNPDAMAQTRNRLQEMLNTIADVQTNGHAQVRRFEHEGVEFSSFSFPGLPIPFEPTSAITDGYAFIGLTPQATLAAVAQARNGSSNLLDNSRFREQFAGDPADVYSVAFFDASRYLADGYGLTSLLCSALANAARSPLAPDREVGIVLPPYAELLQGAKASVTVARVEGDDFVQEGRADRSLLVTATSLIGFVGNSPFLTLIPAAIVMPRLVQEKEQAEARARAALEAAREAAEAKHEHEHAIEEEEHGEH